LPGTTFDYGLVPIAENPQVAAGFFFDFAGLGCTTAPGARSIDVSRPPVKV